DVHDELPQPARLVAGSSLVTFGGGAVLSAVAGRGVATGADVSVARRAGGVAAGPAGARRGLVRDPGVARVHRRIVPDGVRRAGHRVPAGGAAPDAGWHRMVPALPAFERLRPRRGGLGGVSAAFAPPEL